MSATAAPFGGPTVPAAVAALVYGDSGGASASLDPAAQVAVPAPRSSQPVQFRRGGSRPISAYVPHARAQGLLHLRDLQVSRDLQRTAGLTQAFISARVDATRGDGVVDATRGDGVVSALEAQRALLALDLCAAKADALARTEATLERAAAAAADLDRTRGIVVETSARAQWAEECSKDAAARLALEASQRRHLQTTLSSLDAAHTALVSQGANTARALEESKEQARHATFHRDLLDKHIETSLRPQIDEGESERSRLQAAVRDARWDAQEARKEAQMQRQKKQRWREQVEGARAEAVQERLETSAMRARLSELESALESLRASHALVAAGEANQVAAAVVADLERSGAQRALRESSEALKRQKDLVETQAHEHQQALDGALRERDELQQELGALRASLDTVSAAHGSCASEAAAQQQHLDKLSIALDQSKRDAETRLQRVREELRSVGDRCSDLQGQLSAALARANEAESRANDSEAARVQAQTQLASFRAAVEFQAAQDARTESLLRRQNQLTRGLKSAPAYRGRDRDRDWDLDNESERGRGRAREREHEYLLEQERAGRAGSPVRIIALRARENASRGVSPTGRAGSGSGSGSGSWGRRERSGSPALRARSSIGLGPSSPSPSPSSPRLGSSPSAPVLDPSLASLLRPRTAATVAQLQHMLSESQQALEQVRNESNAHAASAAADTQTIHWLRVDNTALGERVLALNRTVEQLRRDVLQQKQEGEAAAAQITAELRQLQSVQSTHQSALDEVSQERDEARTALERERTEGVSRAAAIAKEHGHRMAELADALASAQSERLDAVSSASDAVAARQEAQQQLQLALASLAQACSDLSTAQASATAAAHSHSTRVVELESKLYNLNLTLRAQQLHSNGLKLRVRQREQQIATLTAEKDDADKAHRVAQEQWDSSLHAAREKVVGSIRAARDHAEETRVLREELATKRTEVASLADQLKYLKLQT